MARETSERCPRCGGLVAADAEWCGQCLTPLRGGVTSQEERPPSEAAPEPARDAPGPEPPATAGDAAPRAPGPATERSPFDVRDGTLLWSCPTCEAENPLEAQACRRCGTPFRELFQDEGPEATVEPGRATNLSLLFPGLGHIAAGRRIEGVARILIFAWLLGTIVAIVVPRAGIGLGPLAGLAAVYLLAAGAVYLLSAVDARRVAEGSDQVLSSRLLLYGVSGLLLVTLVFLVVTGPGLSP